MKRRSVRSCYHGSKSSESQQSFLAETAKAYLSFLSFFSAMFAGPQTVEIKKFCYLVNVM